MPCPVTLNGMLQDCSPSQGGIVEVLIANFSDVAQVLTYDGAVFWIDTPAGSVFHQYTFKRLHGSMQTEWQTSEEAGTKYARTQVTLFFSRMETAKRDEISLLARGEFVMLVKDGNGKWWYLGIDRPVRMIAGSAESGVALADRNGYSITMQDEAREVPYEVPARVVDALSKDFNNDFNEDFSIVTQ